MFRRKIVSAPLDCKDAAEQSEPFSAAPRQQCNRSAARPSSWMPTAAAAATAAAHLGQANSKSGTSFGVRESSLPECVRVRVCERFHMMLARRQQVLAAQVPLRVRRGKSQCGRCSGAAAPANHLAIELFLLHLLVAAGERRVQANAPLVMQLQAHCRNSFNFGATPAKAARVSPLAGRLFSLFAWLAAGTRCPPGQVRGVDCT